ncbi:uncharacterized protein LOC110980329 [Acanthaster planci]|uniref:Uncharacterized protein LOC110980329 n=1 Tax=Acanthaster planci TaxID=133434 RepID=A0A8B7YMB0_ACAPL|nr:uncharacterized protein LOC110980329 [Acanthaster planci]
MATRDPLLSNLKAVLLRLKEAKQPIADSNSDLQVLCETVECILRKGLKKPGSLFGLYKRDYWCWMESLTTSPGSERLHPMFSLAIEACKSSTKVRTHQGRGRLLLRICLHKKILAVPIEHLLKNCRMLEIWYDPLMSIIGSELLVESLTSLLIWASEIHFELNIKNASFLDETWTLPVYRQYEFVPSKDLGVIIKNIKQRVFVAKVKPDSVAAHKDRIEPGDILDELYGESLYGSKKGSRIPSLLKQHEGWPIYISVIKCHLRNGKVFYNVKDHLSVLRDEFEGFTMPIDRDLNHKKKSSQNKDEQDISHRLNGSSVHKVKYVGCTDVGKEGGTSVIEGAILKVLQEQGRNPTTYKDVYLELGETNLITWESSDGDRVVMKHCYPEISSCGRRVDALLYFAYVAGDTTCTISKQFKCYVYLATCDKESKQILTSIAQGFGRTTWFV